MLYAMVLFFVNTRVEVQMKKERKGTLILLYILVILAAGLSTIQAPINAQLRAHFTNDFVVATFISYFSSGILMIILALIMKAPRPERSIRKTKVWNWLGGIVGAIYVLLYTIAVANIGSAASTSVLILGQLAFGLFIDQFGMFGMPVRKVSGQRLLGIILVLIGALIVFNL